MHGIVGFRQPRFRESGEQTDLQVLLVHQITQHLNEHDLDETVEQRLVSAVLFGRLPAQHLQAHVQGQHVLQPDQHQVGQGTAGERYNPG